MMTVLGTFPARDFKNLDDIMSEDQAQEGHALVADGEICRADLEPGRYKKRLAVY